MAGDGAGDRTARPTALAELRRRHLEQLLTLIIAAPDGIAQEDLQAATQLSRSLVSRRLFELKGVLDPAAPRRAVGRPRLMYRLKDDAGVVAGVEVGTRRVAVVLTDLHGTPLGDVQDWRLDYETARYPKETLNAACLMINKELRAYSIGRGKLAAVGVSLPGAVSLAARTLSDHIMRRWRRLDVLAHVANRLDLGADIPVVLDNNANFALRAEQRWGAAIGRRHALYLSWSTGIGCSVLADGAIYRGAHGVAAELGHVLVPLSPEERKVLRLGSVPVLEHCGRCGQRECLEQVAGGRRIRQMLNIETIEEGLAAASDDPDTEALMRVAARVVGRGAGLACTLYDPGLVILGGGFHRAFEQVKPFLRDGIDSAAFPQASDGLRIVVGAMGDAAAVRGAADAARDAGAVKFLLPLV